MHLQVILLINFSALPLRSTLFSKFQGVIENGGGKVENVDEWGKRKLAYEINKVNEGYYTLINFEANPELPKELDRVFRITDGVIRHIIVKNEA